MVKRSEAFGNLKQSYLFVEIARRKTEFMKQNPNAKLVSLGIGDTTHPLSPLVVRAMVKECEGMGTEEGYSGYPDFNGDAELRSMIAKNVYGGRVEADEVLVSDGSKPDLARLTSMLFSDKLSVAVQNPVYPAYVDDCVLMRKCGESVLPSGLFSDVVYMDCTPENDFFPDLSALQPTDLIFFCSPNNPTGAVATRPQLEKLVAFAKKNKSIIIYDSAYSAFVSEDGLPRSIYEIDGAAEVAIETASLSKSAGFTGVRLGWTICPKALKYDNGEAVHADWSRVIGTSFNGSSVVSVAGAKAVLSAEGQEDTKRICSMYMENARMVREALNKRSVKFYGGRNCPYIWAQCAEGSSSWDAFQEMLDKCQVVTTPGAGFGTNGDKFLRFSCFAKRADVVEALSRMEKDFPKSLAA